MLLFQNDYLTIDAHETEIIFSLPEESLIEKRLRISFTIQCNWKIRRNILDLDLRWVNNQSKEWCEAIDLKDYKPYYAAINLIKDLWYEIIEQPNKLIDKALSALFIK